MFNMFPFGLGNVFTFTSFTSFTGYNGFNVFSGINGVNGFYGNAFNNMNSSNELENIIKNFINELDLDTLSNNYNDDLNNINEELVETEENCDFIKFEQFKDMYLLKIDLMGIDIRELSIKYDPGIIKISVNRIEAEERCGRLDGYGNRRFVKKSYSKTFDKIEDIDISRVLKNIDNGIYSMRMPKKYVLEDSNLNIVDVDNYIVETEPKEIEKNSKIY